MKTLQEMRSAVETKTANVLTLENAKSLKGKKIRTIYFGYKGQDGVDEFVVGEVISALEYYRNLKENCFIDHPKGFKNRVEYWESYMTKSQLLEIKNSYKIITVDGRDTYISTEPGEDVFTCSDADRYVYFIVLSDEN